MATRNRLAFVRQFKRFIDNLFTVRLISILHTQCPSNSASFPNEPPDSSANKRGRPRLSYHEGSDKTRKRRIHELIEKYTYDELTQAADSLRSNSINQPGPKKKIQKIERDVNGSLAMYMDLEMTKDKYKKLRMYNEDLHGDKLYPPYEDIREAKEKCYPKDIIVTENGASVKLQSLLDHTVHRIFLTLDKEKLHALNRTEFILYGKWGMDGASCQQTTRQQWLEQKKTSVNNRSNDSDDNGTSDGNDAYDEENLSDRAVFIISFVPTRLVANNVIVWINERPSSTRYCRPVKFEFVKENAMNTLNEYKFYDEKIGKLATTHITIENRTYQVTYNLKCTMIDGKTCNVLTGQRSSSSCNVCKVNPSKMNNLSFIRSLPCDENSYKFGLSTLHCWIRFMECLLHIAYNLDFKKSYAMKDDKILKQKRKQMIQKSLKSKLSITVDDFRFRWQRMCIVGAGVRGGLHIK